MNIWIFLFLASGAFILYVLLGYPLAVAVWARLAPRPIQKQFRPQRITIIIPVRNGANWIQAKIDSLLQSDYPPDLFDILVVSDGSTDGTNDIVQEPKHPRVRLLALPPGGKATAVTRGLEMVTSDIVVLTDVRQAFDRQALQKLVACFADPSVGVVTGELIIRAGNTQEEFNTGLYWKYEKWIRRSLNSINAMLGATGSIYAIRRAAAAPIPAEILLDDVYLPFIAVFRGYRIYFEVEAKAYDLPTSLNSEFRRKVRTQAGIYQIIRYFPSLLWPGNRRFVHFFSHKIGRLLLPFALLALAVSSFGLPEPWRATMIGAQVAGYGLALADKAIPERTLFKRISTPLRTFIVLMAAALSALAILVLPARTLWKETVVTTPREDARTN